MGYPHNQPHYPLEEVQKFYGLPLKCIGVLAFVLTFIVATWILNACHVSPVKLSEAEFYRKSLPIKLLLRQLEIQPAQQKMYTFVRQ